MWKDILSGVFGAKKPEIIEVDPEILKAEKPDYTGAIIAGVALLALAALLYFIVKK